MKRSDKEAFVESFRDKVERAPVMYLTNFTGLDVKAMTDLRARLRASGAEYLVVKNRLMRLALEEIDLPDIDETLVGPTGVVLGYDGVVEPAKALADFAKEHDEKPEFKVGVLDGKLLDSSAIMRLAKLPPKEMLLAELAGAMEAPLQALAGALQAKLQETSGLLDALRAQKESG